MSYQDRMYDKAKRLELRIHDSHSAAIQFQSTFEDYLASMDRIFKSKDYTRLPFYRQQYLRGVWDTLFHQLQVSLVWVLVGPDGTKYGPGNDAWLERDSTYKQQMTGEHVWPKAYALGEYKPFGSAYGSLLGPLATWNNERIVKICQEKS